MISARALSDIKEKKEKFSLAYLHTYNSSGSSTCNSTRFFFLEVLLGNPSRVVPEIPPRVLPRITPGFPPRISPEVASWIFPRSLLEASPRLLPGFSPGVSIMTPLGKPIRIPSGVPC